MKQTRRDEVLAVVRLQGYRAGWMHHSIILPHLLYLICAIFLTLWLALCSVFEDKYYIGETLTQLCFIALCTCGGLDD